MFQLYGRLAAETGRRLLETWRALLVLPLYPLILFLSLQLTGAVGILGSILMGLVIAACWSSYLELISQAVSGGRFRLDVEELKRSFAAHFWDVISVLFVFWLIELFTRPLLMSERGPALAAIIGLAIAFFFNVVPELLYQGSSRSFTLLMDSGRFVTEHPVVWFLPNVLFAGLALWLSGNLAFTHPVALLITFGTTFSSPAGIIAVVLGFPLWAVPLVLVAVHAAMIFRGLLFRELSSGAANSRLQAFRTRMRG
jgi:hypothetical protein